MKLNFIYKKFIEKNKCIRSNEMLKKWTHVFILSFDFDVINAFTTYINYTS